MRFFVRLIVEIAALVAETVIYANLIVAPWTPNLILILPAQRLADVIQLDVPEPLKFPVQPLAVFAVTMGDVHEEHPEAFAQGVVVHANLSLSLANFSRSFSKALM
jgi:hypothetical protein